MSGTTMRILFTGKPGPMTDDVLARFRRDPDEKTVGSGLIILRLRAFGGGPLGRRTRGGSAGDR
jgi:hypothetical protein